MPSAHPDSHLHPVASGPAKLLVDAHSSSQPLKLYSGWFCPFVQRVWTVLEEKHIPYQYVEVNPYDKPDELMRLNPRGLVPTLEVDGQALFESIVLCEFLDEWEGGDGRRLGGGGDGVVRARGRIWMDFCQSRLIPAFHRFLQHPLSDPEGLHTHRTEFLDKLKELAGEMASPGPFFFGPELSLVDLVFAPWIVRLWVFDHFKGGLGIPQEGKGGSDEQVWTRLRAWFRALENRPSVKNTTSEREFYLPIYQRYADDLAQSELAKATRLGRGVP